jgi:hypothetical protein
MNSLRLLLMQRGDLTEVEIWCRRRAEDGDTSAMNNLGLVLKRRGNLAEAELWCRRVSTAQRKIQMTETRTVRRAFWCQPANST